MSNSWQSTVRYRLSVYDKCVIVIDGWTHGLPVVWVLKTVFVSINFNAYCQTFCAHNVCCLTQNICARSWVPIIKLMKNDDEKSTQKSKQNAAIIKSIYYDINIRGLFVVTRSNNDERIHYNVGASFINVDWSWIVVDWRLKLWTRVSTLTNRVLTLIRTGFAGFYLVRAAKLSILTIHCKPIFIFITSSHKHIIHASI